MKSSRKATAAAAKPPKVAAASPSQSASTTTPPKPGVQTTTVPKVTSQASTTPKPSARGATSTPAPASSSATVQTVADDESLFVMLRAAASASSVADALHELRDLKTWMERRDGPSRAKQEAEATTNSQPPQSPRGQRTLKAKAASDAGAAATLASPRSKRTDSAKRKVSATPRSGSLSNRKNAPAGQAPTSKALQPVQEDSQAAGPAGEGPLSAGASAEEGKKVGFVGKALGHTAASRRLQQLAPFSPALAHWELMNKSDDELLEPAAWDLQESC